MKGSGISIGWEKLSWVVAVTESAVTGLSFGLRLVPRLVFGFVWISSRGWGLMLLLLLLLLLLRLLRLLLVLG